MKNFVLIAPVLIGFVFCVYCIVASWICCELDPDKRHWWCPVCLLFGKRKV